MKLPNRHTIRLKEYDYSQNGYYFVTVCTQDRENLFGHIIDKKMKLNNAGTMIHTQWNELLNRFHNIVLDEYVVMPNHFHGIIIIKQSHSVGVSFMKPETMTIAKSNHHMGLMKQKGLINQTPTLGLIIRYFKSKCSYEIHKNGFNNNIFQRNFYEHIIRNEKELYAIREYIEKNPSMWEQDRNNPEKIENFKCH